MRLREPTPEEYAEAMMRAMRALEDEGYVFSTKEGYDETFFTSPIPSLLHGEDNKWLSVEQMRDRLRDVRVYSNESTARLINRCEFIADCVIAREDKRSLGGP